MGQTLRGGVNGINDHQKTVPVEPIATFAELTFFDKRWLTLYPDRVFVQRKLSNGTETECTVYLERLSPEAGRGKAKRPLFMLAFWVFAFGMILLFVSKQNELHVMWAKPLRPKEWLALACIFGGIGGLLATLRSIEFCHFTNRDGIVVLSVRCLGSDSAKYEQFIDVLVRQIQAARLKADANSKNSP
ncbi:MAG: hypothetical protein AABP62_01105 [Planctomycetota bacterium]